MSFKERIERNRERLNNPEKAANDNNEYERSFNSDFYGIESIRNMPPFFILRLASGKRKAMPYSSIVDIDFDPEEGIMIIETTNKNITITGRNLEQLLDYLAFNRVRYIQANIGADTTEEGIFIKEIAIA